ncbi:sigma-70 family RNA polymerase sigma factor [Planotetraspora sp. A-T 1434]|uniref:RNA polymerase sigma factor n=1 Tax=Planotetraspora sp. A-T 1434 TaxID=2979219 RepID=UPI0021C07453|nr:sigma-70 family RNA polymerase sigma factor [Planotetraspora sp. A-T 1434]MCT9931332.1 sigma-70 family RNA polymerase sigma factor [Planotetraspora sp. A-T 1434]
MTPSLTGQRSRSELIAELYERHAAGLFAYCHDQLGESASAADAIVAVFTGVPTVEPPRAVLYALARREIYRRDVSYALPAVDSIADPATALIERVFRDIRPHQREVLLLSAVCGLVAPELAVVLDVAPDTAEELRLGARRRFAQTLETATAAARSAPFVARDVAEVYDAIGVAPVEDVLARLPWRRPSAAVRARVLSSLPFEDPGTATAAPKLPTKKLWPTTPTWPLPLNNPDQVSNTCVVQTGAITPAETRRKPKHEATTEPMPKLRGALLAALGESRTRKRRAAEPAALPAPVPMEAEASEGFDAFRPADTDEKPPMASAASSVPAASAAEASVPVAGAAMAADVPVLPVTPVSPSTDAPSLGGAVSAQNASAPAGAPVTSGSPSILGTLGVPANLTPGPTRGSAPGAASRVTSEATAWATTGAAAEATSGVTAQAGGTAARTVKEPTLTRTEAAAARRGKGGKGGKGGKKVKPIKMGEHHYDWVWELVGFLICLAIALIVFFCVPTIVTP